MDGLMEFFMKCTYYVAIFLMLFTFHHDRPKVK